MDCAKPNQTDNKSRGKKKQIDKHKLIQMLKLLCICLIIIWTESTIKRFSESLVSLNIKLYN